MESSNNSDARPSTRTHPIDDSNRLKIEDWLKLISNLTIPLIIGIFTIFIAIHQQNVAQANRNKDALHAAEVRMEDLEKARKDREEDKEVARLQREEDKKGAHLQREEDKEIERLRRVDERENARLQREEDQETARLQREVELNMANEKRMQEYELAEKQRSLYESQRAHEFEVTYQNHINNLMLEEDRRKEKILVDYQRQLAKLILDYQLILNASQSILRFVLQMRTRAALRLLNPTRRTIVVQTLFQAGLLDATWEKENSPLYRANVSGVQFGLPLDHNFSNYLLIYNYLDIEQADVRYASFRSVSFRNSPSFKFSKLDYTDWSFAKFSSIQFHNKMTMNNAIFANSNLEYVTFEKISMNLVSFRYNMQCKCCTFDGTSLLGARLDHSLFVDSKFTSLSMADGNMSGGSFSYSTFEHLILDRVDFSGAGLFGSKFYNVSMVNCSMMGTFLNFTQFLNVNTKGCKGLKRI